MDVTGVVQIQCSHVMVKSTVDLQLGERYFGSASNAFKFNTDNIYILLDLPTPTMQSLWLFGNISLAT